MSEQSGREEIENMERSIAYIHLESYDIGLVEFKLRELDCQWTDVEDQETWSKAYFWPDGRRIFLDGKGEKIKCEGPPEWIKESLVSLGFNFDDNLLKDHPL